MSGYAWALIVGILVLDFVSGYVVGRGGAELRERDRQRELFDALSDRRGVPLESGSGETIR